MKPNTLFAQSTIEKQLSEFWMPHLIACEDLFKHLEYVDVSGKEIRANALRHNLQTFDAMLAKDVPKNWRFKEYRKRTIITLVGEITYIRRIYTEPSGICHALLDEVLGIRTRFRLAPDAFLWIAKTAADISFRKTARAFFERTGAKISHWLVMAVVHEEGELILEDAYRRAYRPDDITADGQLISSERLYVEFDGIHIPLQKTTHTPRLPRWQYEQDRQKQSFELKVAVAYAGKDAQHRRGHPVFFALDDKPAYFWPLLNAKIASVYDMADVERLRIGSDAAGWCKNCELDVMSSVTEVTRCLDRFHINREIRRAFGGRTKAASYFIGLAYARRTEKLMRDLQRVINHARDKSRYLALQSYLRSNMDLLKAGAGPSMGTMEGTNAHVWAARMKVWGGAWSRKGAACMAAIRARLASGEELIRPKPDNVMYDDLQVHRRIRYEESLIGGHWDVPKTEGTGYEPPRGSLVLTTHMAPELYGWLNYS
jgi:hypothetical protein